MARVQGKDQAKGNKDGRGVSGRILARPLDSLLFLLPLILVYELSVLFRPTVVVAYDLMRHFFELFGRLGVWAPGAAVVVILLATQIASGREWTIRWRRVLWMYPEAVLLAVPLLGLSWAVRLNAAAPSRDHLLSQLAIGIGAGVYEELVFRLVLISVIVLIGADLLKLRPRWVAVVAICFSSLLFAAHHHPPMGSEPFHPLTFSFRTIAGLYLAGVFWFRGYGAAAGCHAMYNTAVILLGAFYLPG